MAKSGCFFKALPKKGSPGKEWKLTRTESSKQKASLWKFALLKNLGVNQEHEKQENKPKSINSDNDDMTNDAKTLEISSIQLY